MKAMSILSFFFFFKAHLIRCILISFLSLELSWLLFFHCCVYSEKGIDILICLCDVSPINFWKIVMKTAVLLISVHCNWDRCKNSMHKYLKCLFCLLVEIHFHPIFLFFLSFVWRLTEFLHALCDWRSAFLGWLCMLLWEKLVWLWYCEPITSSVSDIDSGPDLQSPWMSGCLSSCTGASQLHLACFFTPLGTLCPVPSLFISRGYPDCQCGCFEHPLWLKHSFVISTTILPKCPRFCPVH